MDGRLRAFFLDWPIFVLSALMTDVNYLIRDPRPGAVQEILRLPKKHAVISSTASVFPRSAHAT